MHVPTVLSCQNGPLRILEKSTLTPPAKKSNLFGFHTTGKKKNKWKCDRHM